MGNLAIKPGGRCPCRAPLPWHLLDLAAPTFRLHCRCGRRYRAQDGELVFTDRIVGPLPQLRADSFGTRIVPPRR